MHSLEIEYQIQFADIVEQAVEAFDEDLDEVEEGEGRFGGGADEDEVKGCVMPICDGGRGVGVAGVFARGGGGGRWR